MQGTSDHLQSPFEVLKWQQKMLAWQPLAWQMPPF
jgi:hypothetical protein